MEIDEQGLSSFSPEPQGFVVSMCVGVFCSGAHEGSSLQTEYPQSPGGGVNKAASVSWCTGLQIEGSENIRGFREPWNQVSLIPYVVSQGDDMNPVFDELASQPWNDSLAPCGVLSVYNNGINPVFCLQLRKSAV